MSSHGPQYDDFTANANHGHGGAEFDEGFRTTRTRDLLVDSFPQKKGLDAHGPRWDEFGWRDMPSGHGHNFDSDFRAEAALDGSHDHGTWFDVFRGGTQVRYVADGCDYEGTVVNGGDDHLIVRPHHRGADGGGRDHELGLQQLRAFRHVPGASQSDTRKPTASPGRTDSSVSPSSAEAPSAHDAKAQGGGRTLLDTTSDESKVANKTAGLSDVDVAKTIDELRTLAAED